MQESDPKVIHQLSSEDSKQTQLVVGEFNHIQQLEILAWKTRQLLQRELAYQAEYATRLAQTTLARHIETTRVLERHIVELEREVAQRRAELQNHLQTMDSEQLLSNVEIHATDQQLDPQLKNQEVAIPLNLLNGLKKIETTGSLPLLISRELENFLTEHGLYSSAMTPADAWEVLQKFVHDGHEEDHQVDKVEVPNNMSDFSRKLASQKVRRKLEHFLQNPMAKPDI